MATAAIPAAGERRATRLRFVATIFTGSFLLFLVQPMIARMALPRLGGAPAVWNSAMVVYQALLLAGYAYAHWLGRFSPTVQARLHLGLFAVAGLMLPIGLAGAIPPADANPFLWVPWLFLVSIGPLFLVVAAQAPMIQRWFSVSGGGDPYSLYAASNLGSFAGLLSYPLIVEPLLRLDTQRWLWTGGYGLLALLIGWCASGLPRGAASEHSPAAKGPRPGWRTLATWIVLAAVPSGLILSTTLHLTTDVVAMPLLWVVPLGVYLLSFTVAFAENRRAADAISKLAPLILLLAVCALSLEVKRLDFVFAAISIVNLFTVSVALHSQLFRQRPEPRQLTLFYLTMSVGGVLGGIFCALVAPLVFNWTYEHLLLLIAAAALLAGRSPFKRFQRIWDGGAVAGRLTLAGVAIAIIIAALARGSFDPQPPAGASHLALIAILALGIVAVGNRALFAVSVAALMLSAGGWQQLALSATPGKVARSYFGIYSIRPQGPDARMLVHGTTLHGVQNLGSPARERMATSYYAPLSGVGLAMAAAEPLFGDRARIEVVGLGSGTLACYARPGQRWTFYEIDSLVVQIARDPRRFTFLPRCLPDAPVVLGDGRISLEHASQGAADILVLDAFSSDSIPMHLLTRDAFDLYRRHLRTHGLLLVHISNRNLDLEPVIAAAAAAGGWEARLRTYRPDAAERSRNYSGSDWIALSADPAALGALVARNPSAWSPLRPRAGFAAWTDDHASLLPLIRWRR